MFKYIAVTIACLLVIGVAIAGYAGYFKTFTVTSGSALSTGTIDLSKANNQANIQFECLSSKVVVYGRVNAGSTGYKLASYSTTADGTTKVNVTVPYRIIYYKYTTIVSAPAHNNHTKTVTLFSW